MFLDAYAAKVQRAERWASKENPLLVILSLKDQTEQGF